MKKEIFILLIVIGFISKLTPALDIIHEWFHYTVSVMNGIPAEIDGWSHIVFDRYCPPALYAGYFGELFLYSGLYFFTSRKTIGGLFLGMVHVVAIEGYGSTDFTIHAMQMYGNQAKVTYMQNVWLLVATILLVTMWVLFAKHLNAKKGKNK